MLCVHERAKAINHHVNLLCHHLSLETKYDAQCTLECSRSDSTYKRSTRVGLCGSLGIITGLPAAELGAMRPGVCWASSASAYNKFMQKTVKTRQLIFLGKISAYCKNISEYYAAAKYTLKFVDRSTITAAYKIQNQVLICYITYDMPFTLTLIKKYKKNCIHIAYMFLFFFK